MKAVKILFGLLSALWSIALVPKLFGHYAGPAHLVFSHNTGAVVGILIGAAISIALFRSALTN